jgi:hypothetical protein
MWTNELYTNHTISTKQVRLHIGKTNEDLKYHTSIVVMLTLYHTVITAEAFVVGYTLSH